MNAREEIAGILEEWLQLTQAEGAAIQAAAWSDLARIQARKATLQEGLTKARGHAHAEPGAVRAKVARIISLVTRNGVALAEKLRLARERQRLLDQSNRNLHRIQRSYVRPPSPAAWHSYS